jgi:CheY-like chemotaxis protein
VQHKRVLVVDDEADIREIASASLELMYGWDVVTASNGREAVAIASHTEVDAILLDVMMPDMDGPTVFGMLRDTKAIATPVILLTAKVQSADRQRYMQIGVQGVIAKPFDPLLLADTVAEILGWS